MKKPTVENQFDRFVETARALGCDEEKERFEEALGKIARHKLPPDGLKHSKKRRRRTLANEPDFSLMERQVRLSMKEPDWLLELKTLAEFPDFPLEIVKGLIDFAESPQQFVMFKVNDGGAAVARECVVSLDPSDSLLSLMSALRTWNANFNVVKHGESPI